MKFEWDSEKEKKQNTMLVRMTLDPDEQATPEQLAELERAAKMPFVYDEENPPLTKEQLSKMYRVKDKKRETAGNIS